MVPDWTTSLNFKAKKKCHTITDMTLFIQMILTSVIVLAPNNSDNDLLQGLEAFRTDKFVLAVQVFPAGKDVCGG